MKLSNLLIFSVAISAAAAVHADSFRQSHFCSKPVKPYKFTSQWEAQSFKDDVNRYKTCITNFVDEQNAKAETHRTAASEAIDEWNEFVRWELK